MTAEDLDSASFERLLGRPVADAERAGWGFTNRTDFVDLGGGERVVLQTYRDRRQAEPRLRIMRALAEPAGSAGIRIPRVRELDLDADPPWVAFELLPGSPATEAGEAGVGGRRFDLTARAMGELLGRFRGLGAADLELDDLWADPPSLAAAAPGWAEAIPELDARARDTAGALAERVPELFAGRPAVLAHGDFVPVNVLLEGDSISGLLDFEATRFADPLFDVAWWHWAVSFAPPSALARGWEPFVQGAGFDPREPDLAERLRTLQVLRMLELLGGEGRLASSVRGTVLGRPGSELG